MLLRRHDSAGREVMGLSSLLLYLLREGIKLEPGDSTALVVGEDHVDESDHSRYASDDDWLHIEPPHKVRCPSSGNSVHPCHKVHSRPACQP